MRPPNIHGEDGCRIIFFWGGIALRRYFKTIFHKKIALYSAGKFIIFNQSVGELVFA